MAILDEHYKVIAVESLRLTIRGVRSGNVLVIKADPDNPIGQQDFHVGELIALSDPASAPLN